MMLKLQSRFARRIGQRFDAAMIEIPAAIENHFLDAVLDRLLRYFRANPFGRCHVAAGFGARRRSRNQRHALRVVDHLRIGMRSDRKIASRGRSARTLQPPPDALMNALA